MSNPSTLYGVKHANSVSGDGTIKAIEWIRFRAPKQSGKMTDQDRVDVFWFFDPGARDEFKSMFGGINVTLHRNDAPQVISGEAAKKLLQKMGGQ